VESIAGTYRTTVAASTPDLRQHHMAGSWTVEFDPDGILNVTAPPSFTGTRSGYSFRVASGQLQTDLFSDDVCAGSSPGAYRWVRTAHTLALALIDDPCRARAALLSRTPWERVG
jgi:hypothetical protein